MPANTIEDNKYLLRISGSEIKIEEPKEFDTSFFREEYIQIFRVIEKIISSTNANRIREKAANESGKYCSDIRIHNIVPIIGKRGSGKSSILHTVSSVLNDGIVSSKSDQEDSFWGKIPVSFINKKFIVMDCIDGSLLEKDEDIFPIVLAQMYNMLKKHSDNHRCSEYYGNNSTLNQGNQEYQRRELNKKFTEIYKSAMQVSDDQYHDYWSEGMTPISSLNQLSGSLELRKNFRRLLNDYLVYYSQFVKKWNSEKSVDPHDHYIVIPIDDLDLNIENGFEMLEKIHRYLMVPNIIILLAHEQKQFMRLSDNHFYKMIPEYDSRMNAAARDIARLTDQFLEKVMPRNYRIYVPEFFVRRERWVNIQDDRDKHNYSPRDMIFRLLYKRLGMRMDVVGTKKHFFEYESLRYFANFVRLLYDMESPVKEDFDKCKYLKNGACPPKLNQTDENCAVNPKDKQSQYAMEVFRHNYRLLKQEITQVMAGTNLGEEPALSQYRVDSASVTSFAYQTRSLKTKFDEITSEVNPIPRSFINLYDSMIIEGDQLDFRQVGHRDYKILLERLKFFQYSYGEILYIIYKYGRMYGNKVLIHCLLADYSLELMRNYVHIRFDEDIKRKQVERKNLILAVNGSVVGSWGNNMMPRVNVGMRRVPCGTIVDVKMEKVFILDIAKDIKQLKDSKATLKELKEEVRKILHAILIIGMFFDCRSYKLPKMFRWNDDGTRKDGRISNKETDDIDGVNRLRNLHITHKEITTEPKENSFCPITGFGTYSFLNFVGNALKYIYKEGGENDSTKVDYDDNIQLLLNCAVKYIKKTGGNNKTFDRATREIQDEIITEFNQWHEKYDGFVLPIYDIDICYNLLKRLVEHSYGQPGVIESEDVLDRYIETYQYLLRKLDQNDQYYADREKCRIALCPNGVNVYHYHFAQAFREYPYMKWLGVSLQAKNEDSTEANKKTYIENWFKDVFARLFQGGGGSATDEHNSSELGIKSEWFDNHTRSKDNFDQSDSSYSVQTPGGYGD